MASTPIITQIASGTYDPSSPEYKKARRQYIRTTKNRSHDVDATWTPFRAAEKKYKARFPPPDLSGVLDLTAPAHGIPSNDEVANEYVSKYIDANGSNVATEPPFSKVASGVFTVPAVPGLVLLPSFVPPDDQRQLVRWSLRQHARHPNETNLDAHYILPSEGLWNAHLESSTESSKCALVHTRAPLITETSPSTGPRQLISNDAASPDNFHSLQTLPKPPPEPSATLSECSPSELLPKLRWANIGWSYHWGSKQYDFSKGKGEIDSRVRGLCKSAVSSVPWENVFGHDDLEGWGNDDWRRWQDTYEPDAGIVNFYQTKDTLMAHVDRSEVCATSPLVSISLGNAAIFLIGGLTRDTEPIPILLRSGDVVIMSGPACRRAYHGVPRILENTLPEHFSQPPEADCGIADWEPYKDYMQATRININVRQVFPKGFVPGAHNAT
ncbi:hypothetical protein HYDPIDRAFT_172447 [Hydnomerulius pinastri MD-312]|nr:hypothetical protein HYDPIDRAFT_172447 [Hydnomerulius pinastri MD-312]